MLHCILPVLFLVFKKNVSWNIDATEPQWPKEISQVPRMVNIDLLVNCALEHYRGAVFILMKCPVVHNLCQWMWITDCPPKLTSPFDFCETRARFTLLLFNWNHGFILGFHSCTIVIWVMFCQLGIQIGSTKCIHLKLKKTWFWY